MELKVQRRERVMGTLDGFPERVGEAASAASDVPARQSEVKYDSGDGLRMRSRIT